MTARELQTLRQQVENLRLRNAQLEAQLGWQQSNEPDLFRFLFDTMDEGFCVIEFFDGPHGPLSDYVHVLANTAYARHAGIADVTGQKLREMVPDEADDWVARYGEVLRTGKPLQFEQELVATGRVLSVTTFRIEPAERRQVAVLFKDVTERHRAEAALQQLNEQLEQRVAIALAERSLLAELVEHSIARVQVVDSSLTFLAINQRAAKDFHYLFGRTPRSGDSLVECLAGFPAEQQIAMAYWRRALAGESFTEVITYAKRHFESRFTPLRDAAGHITGAYLFVYDITRRITEQQRLLEAEKALRQAQKMEAVGQLTGGIAHDFNNLLAGILGAQELMHQRLRQDRHGDLPALLDSACDSAQRAATLVQRLLAFSRQQTLQPQPTHIGTLVQGMHELISRSVGPSIEVICHFDDHDSVAFIDPPQLESALLNLCINARDAMPAGGRITIDISQLELQTDLAKALEVPVGRYLCLAVMDSGQGMSAEIVARAVEPFFTTKPPGRNTGLGLSMVYGFLRQSGGQLQISSQPGEGTCMRLYLPWTPKTVPLCPAPINPVAQAQAVTRRITLVEDQAPLRAVITEVLQDLGHQVVSHANGPSALAGPGEPELLITDIGLPGGLDGRQVADAFRARWPNLPVLFITGYDAQATLNGRPLPAQARVLTKPFTLEALVEQVAQLLH
ncbi:hybrid sensor histidine kinase/response regulator [Pseudomonas xantholysinigenes]|uniref:histidine kinase n=1 Tax=Pseudomonas xantholysinigenes TaxID=2745490 RepID=A0A9E6PS91_9PSED|nr:PAS domain-containing protein [Pseudomonas xantholysinigenes]QXI36301.1 PAS domain-containing protein [Pseudomonas xantholysinigenes]